MFGGNAPENAKIFRPAHDLFRPQSRTSRFPRIPSPSADFFGCACHDREYLHASFQRRTRIPEFRKRAKIFDIDRLNSAPVESRTARQTKTSSCGASNLDDRFYVPVRAFLIPIITMA